MTVGEPSLYLDEAYSIYYCQQPLENFSLLFEQDINPPLYFLLLKFWMTLFGDSEVAVRSLSVLFSSGTVFMLVMLGKRFFRPYSGLVAALLFSFSAWHFRIGQEARAYALLGFLTVVSFWFFLSLMESPNRRKGFLLLVINTMLMYTHWMGFFVLFAQFVAFLLWKKKTRETILNYLLGQAIVGILLIPAIYYLSAQKIGGTGKWAEAPGAIELWNIHEELLYFKWMIVVVLVVTVLALLLGKPKTGSRFYLLFLWGPISFLLVFLVSQWFPMFLPKYLLFATIGMYFLLAEATFRLPFPALVIEGLACVFIVLFAFNFSTHQSKGEDWKGAVAFSNEFKSEDTGMLVMPVYHRYAWAYYADREAFRDHKKLYEKLYDQRTYFISKLEPDFFAYESQRHNRMVLVKGKNHGQWVSEAQDLLSETYTAVGDKWYEGIHVVIFEKKPVDP